MANSMKHFIPSVLLILLALFGSCKKQGLPSEGIFAINNLVAWCIVPYDSMNRSPKERVEMLKELGFKKYAWDWRLQHLEELDEELKLLKENKIELSGVWFPVGFSIETLLHENNFFIIETLKKNDIKTTLWVSFSDMYFGDINTVDQKKDKAWLALEQIHQLLEGSNIGISVYNHGGWFGFPENQVEVINNLTFKAGIVYNFHHGHSRIDDFEVMLQKMLPHLTTVNLNGMNHNGPKILTIGEGSLEKSMIDAIQKSGYKGEIGILGHIAERDAKEVLKDNIKGLEAIISN